MDMIPKDAHDSGECRLECNMSTTYYSLLMVALEDYKLKCVRLAENPENRPQDVQFWQSYHGAAMGLAERIRQGIRFEEDLT